MTNPLLPAGLSNKHVKKYCNQLMTTRNKELQSENDSLAARVQSLTDSLYTTLKENDALSAKLSALVTQNKALNTHNTELEVQLDNAKYQLQHQGTNQ